MSKWAVAVFLTLGVGSSSYSNVFFRSLQSESEYLSGEKLCKLVQASLGHQRGIFVSVPLDYTNVSRGHTNLYVHFDGEIKPEQPSVIFFDGGPGLSSHQHFVRELRGWNIIRFDQRGTGCSRPKSYKEYRDSSIYSSENTAKDAEQIRLHLKIKAWSVFGSSYGTLPATIYASEFPSSTTSLILEGTMVTGAPELWNGPRRRKLQQRVLKELPSDIRQQINDATPHELPSHWFSTFANEHMIRNHGLDEFKESLLQFPKIKSDLATALRQAVEQSHVPPTTVEDMIAAQDTMVLAAIGCRELSLADPATTVVDDLQNGELVPSRLFSVATELCKPLGLTHNPATIYSAKKHPVKVPTTYFQGSQDGPTEATWALEHFNSVSVGPKQLLILRGGGHTPNQEILASGGLQQALQEGLLVKALKGVLISESELTAFNAAGDEKWRLKRAP